MKDFTFKVIVKKGSTVPLNPAATREDGVMLWQTGMIDPLTAAEMYLGNMTRDPRTIARRMFLWQSNPSQLFPELEGKENIIDQEAVTHIAQIISTDNAMDMEELVQKVFSNVANPQMPTPAELDQMSKHIRTEQLYTQGVEIDPNLPEFDRLTNEQKAAIQKHIVIETGILS